MNRSPIGERYALPARLLHWGIAVMIPLQFWLGWSAEAASTREVGGRLIRLHYQWGVLIAVLMLPRVGWRLLHGVPAALSGEPIWRRLLAASVHWLLYALLLVLPLSGYVIWVWMGASMDIFGVVTVPRVFTPPAEDETWRAIAWYVHYWAGWTLVALLAVHIGAAVWHQWIRRDGLIRRRML